MLPLAFDQFAGGDRVRTPAGVGTVVYVRMAAPNYDRPAAYSVKLDASPNPRGYSGTIFAAESVTAWEDPQ